MAKLRLSNGMEADVDDDMLEILSAWKWQAQPTTSRDLWYAITHINGRTVYMHRLILGLTSGTATDHRDGNGLNNHRHNLRRATPFQNSGNRRKQRGCSSPYRGVTWDKATGRWRAQIMMQGKNRSLGRFTNEADAARAYDGAALVQFGEFARTNF